MPKKIISLFLAGFLLLVSCSRDEVIDAPEEYTRYLTGIYKGGIIDTPDGYEICENIAPYSSGDEVRLLLMSGDGSFILLTCGMSGERDLYEFSLPVFEHISSGALGKNELYLSCRESTGLSHETFLYRYSFEDGGSAKSGNLNPYFLSSDGDRVSIMNTALSDDGTVYLSSENEIVALDENFAKKYYLKLDNTVDGIAAGERVYVLSYFERGMGICPLENGSPGSVVPFGGAKTIIPSRDGEYELYCMSGEGIFGLKSDGDAEPLMNFQNSGADPGRLMLLSSMGYGTFAVSETSKSGGKISLRLLKKSADIDLYDVRKIEVAVLGSARSELKTGVIEYNAAHRGTTVVLSEFGTGDDYADAVYKATVDITSGIYKPDIIIGTGFSDIQKSAREEFIDASLYTDLTPLFENDGMIDIDDLFDGVREAFTVDGKMWGITDSFCAETLVMKSDTFGVKASAAESDKLGEKKCRIEPDD